MKLSRLASALDLETRSARARLDNEVTGGYASDLLSDVLGNSRNGDLWVTLQVHGNIVAVASMKDLAGIVLVNGRQPEEETLERAEAEGVPILVSRLSAFDLIGKLYGLGLRGSGAERPAERETT